jgi:DNA-binding transcriptional MerR regulator
MVAYKTSMSPRYSLDDLARLSGLPARTVRYYLQRGLVPRPHGERRGAWYDQVHLERLLQIGKWTAAGLSLERIEQLLAEPAATLSAELPRRRGDVAVRSHVHLGEGLELVIDAERAGIDPATHRRLVRALLEAADQVLGR